MYDYNAELIRVIDGDTIVCRLDLGFSMFKKATVRLAGINTPESRTRDLNEKKHGLEAKKVLGDMLKSCKELIIEVEDIGKFGRPLGYVKADGLNINSELIDRGYAYAYDGEQKLTYEEMLAKYPAMKNARQKFTK